METMTKLMLTALYSTLRYLATCCVPVTWQAAILFRNYFTPVVLQQLILSVTSGYRHKVDEDCTVVGYYAVSSGNLWPTFRDNLLVPS